MKIHRFPMKVYEERLRCNKTDDCMGWLNYTGRSYSNSAKTTYHHKCSACEKSAMVDGAQYPKIGYKSVI